MRKRVRNVILVLLLVILCVGSLFLLHGFWNFRKALRREPLNQKIAELRADPDYTAYDELPARYVDAVVAAEDHRFFTHPGIDLLAIGRAALHDLETVSLAEGGSTITQQLAKNLYFTQKKLFSRKAAELWMAIYLEAVCTKQEILEMYVNTSYFGDGYYGIGQASRGYFGKEPLELSDEEATLLAGIPRAPSVYALTNHPELAVRRQGEVLRQMVRYGYLDEEEAQGMRYDPE